MSEANVGGEAPQPAEGTGSGESNQQDLDPAQGEDDSASGDEPELSGFGALSAGDEEIVFGALDAPPGYEEIDGILYKNIGGVLYADMTNYLELDGFGNILSALTTDFPQPAKIYIPRVANGAGGPEVLKSIGASAFANNVLGEIYFDSLNEIETIGDGAFLSRTVMTIANDGFISNSLTSIGADAFRNSGITKIQLPSGFETLGTGVFAQSKLQSIDIPASVKTIPADAFYQCSSITAITLHDGLERINENAFRYMTSTNNLVFKLPQTAATLDYSIFNWGGLNVTIDVSDWAYPGDIDWQNSLAYFYGTVKYKDNSPDSWWYFKDGKLGGIKPEVAATDSANYDAAAFPSSTLTLATYPIDANHKLEIPAKIGGSFITEILPNAFGYYANDNQNLGLAKRYRYIGELSFADTSSEPSQIATIGGSAFWNLTKLENVTLPNSLTTIGGYAFCAATILEKIEFPELVTTLGANAFYSNANLGEVRFLGGAVSNISTDAFFMDMALYDIYLLEKEKETVPGFANGWGATSATVHWKGGEEVLPPGIYTDTTGVWVFNESTNTIIGYKYSVGGYLGATGTTPDTSDLVVPAMLTRELVDGDPGYISDTSDSGYPATKDVAIETIADSTTQALRGKLNGVKAFDNIFINEGIKSIAGFATIRITDGNISIPSTATEILTLAFSGSYAGSVTFNGDGENITKIDMSAFENNRFTSLTLPKNLVTIGDGAFRGTVTSGPTPSNLLKGPITIPSTVTSIGGAAFAGHTFNTAAEGDPENGITQFTVLQSWADAAPGVKNTAAWGVTVYTGKEVVFNPSTSGITAGDLARIVEAVPAIAAGAAGDIANLSYTVGLKHGDFVKKITMTDSDGNVLQVFPAVGSGKDKPDGSLNYLTSTLSSTFLVKKNDTYTLTLDTMLGHTATAEKIVDIFGEVTISPDPIPDVVISFDEWYDILGDGTKTLAQVDADDIIALASASAIDKDSGMPATLAISAADVAAVKVLAATNGQQAVVYLTATYSSRYNGINSTTVSTPVKFIVSDKIYRTFNVRAIDITDGIGKFTGGDTDATKQNEYSSATDTVGEANIPTPVVDSSSSRADDVTFLGWYLMPDDTLVKAIHSEFVTAIATTEVGTKSLTYEARFIIDHDGNGKDDRFEGITRFNYDHGSVKYNGSAPVAGTYGVINTSENPLSSNTFSVQSDVPGPNVKSVVITTDADYLFKGWTKDGGAALEYTDGIEENNISFVADRVAIPVIYTAVFQTGVKFQWHTDFAAATAGGDAFRYLYVPVGSRIADADDAAAGYAAPVANTRWHFDGWTATVGSDGNGTGDVIGIALYEVVPTGPMTYNAKFSEAAAYSVAYDLDGGKVNSSLTVAAKTVKWSDSDLAPDMYVGEAKAPVKAGYNFEGWKVGTDDIVYATKYSDLSVTNDNSTAVITLVAQWTERTDYKVEYNTQSGTPTSITAKSGVKFADTGLLPSQTVTRTGYAFGGWYTATGGSGTKVETTTAYSSLVADDNVTSVTLYAKWTERTDYKVEYDTQSGTPAIGDKTGVKFADTGLLPTQTVTRTGYAFGGWYTAVNGGGTKVETTTAYSSLVANDGVTSVTLYAKWTERTDYTVEYNTQSGTPTTIDDKTGVKFADTGLLPTQTVTRTGYTFGGWYTAVNGSGTKAETTTAYSSLVADDNVTSVTLYAKWTERTDYKVEYNTQSGTPSSITAKSGVKFADTGLLPSQTVTRTGYTFGGWYTAVNGSGTKVENTTAYSALVTGDNITSATLYAKWTERTDYKVEYNTQSGTPAIGDKTGVKFADTGLLPSQTVTRTGYAFGGWYTATGGSGTKVETTTAYSSLVANDNVTSVTLYAKWTIVDTDDSWVKVIFSANGGDAGSVPAPILYNTVNPAWADGTAFPVGTPTRDGYTFGSWHAASTGDGAAISTLDGLLPITANKTVYAKWNVDTSQTTHWTTVSFDANNGTGAPAPILYNITEHKLADGVTFPTSTPTRGGYIFDEWNTLPSGGGTTVAAITDLGTITAPVTVWAKWIVDTTYPPSDWWKVTFDAKGGTGASTIHVHKTDHILGTGESWPTTTRTGYTFGQWEDSAAIAYTATDMASLNKDLALSATWTIVPSHITWATVTFNANGGTGAPASILYNMSEGKLADDVTFPASPATDPTRPGYNFDSWNTLDTGLGTTIGAITDLEPISGNRTIYAKWNVDTTSSVWNTVTFDANGGAGAPGVIRYNTTPPGAWADGTVFPTASPTRTGYTFDEWNKAVNGSGVTVSGLPGLVTDVASGSTTIFAQWTANQYTLNFNANGGVAGTTQTKPVTYDAAVGTLPGTGSGAPTRTGYTFEGWSTSRGASNTVNFTSSYIVDFTSSKTVYAVWEIKTYTVTYIGNGHTSGAAPAATTHNHGSNATVKTQETLARDSHSFSGWNTAADGSGSAYAAGSAIGNITGNQTLYAQWTYNAPPPTDPPDDPPRRPEDPDDDPDDPPVDPPTPPVVPPADPPESPEGGFTEPTDPEADSESGTTGTTTTVSKISGFDLDDMTKLEAQSGNIFNNLANGNVPLGGFYAKGAWSALDLILAIIAVILSVILSIGALGKRKDRQKKAGVGFMRSLAISAGIIVLILTVSIDDFSQPVTWVNQWTPLVGIVFALQIVLFAAYKITAARATASIGNADIDL